MAGFTISARRAQATLRQPIWAQQICWKNLRCAPCGENKSYPYTIGQKLDRGSRCSAKQVTILPRSGLAYGPRSGPLCESYNKATNSVIAKRTGLHATMACYTFSERSWHTDTQSMGK